MDSKKPLGKKGENLAASLLKRRGYRILATNFHTRFGEIDIVAQDGNTLVFVEVKTRTSRVFGLPEESIGKAKLSSLQKASQIFRAKHPNLPETERIDAVAIELDDKGKPTRKEVIKNITAW